MSEIPTSLLTESRDRYLTYALSVISSRALPDVRDGLKPVQRRILFAMRNNLRLNPDHAPRKSAAIVGAVLASYHPHGDVACYEAMVRMAQDFSLRYPLVDGHGNFGSLDGDSAAAYRYTEARLKPLALSVIGEIDEETVPFRPNFDATVEEPVVLPSRVPNLLINGASGIAVGMATSIPPHNLKEVCKALLELSKNPELPDAKLLQHVKAPDFPSGCLILNTKKELADIYSKGRGMIRMRGEWELEESTRGKHAIVVTAIPYSVNKAQLVERIASLIIDRKLPQLVDVRDESTSDIRIVLELAPQADPQAAVAFLCKHTPFEHNFAVNFTALVPAGDGSTTRPEQLSLRQCLKAFLDFREEVVERKLAYERRKLQERIHILEGFAAIYDALDEAIKIVRQSSGRQDSAEKLRKRFSLSEPQSFAIVDMRIYQLSKTSIHEIREELKEKRARVVEIDKILKSKDKVREIVRSEIEGEVQRFGDRRRCKIVHSQDEIELEFKEEDYVVEEDVYAIVTRDGWVKRIRQGNELSGTRLREGDAILAAFPVTTREVVAFITNFGSLFTLKVSEFPASGGYGNPVQKLLKFRDGETIIECFVLKPDPRDGKSGGLEALPAQVVLDPARKYLLATAQGMGYACILDDLGETKRNGKKIFKLREGDTLVRIAPLPEATLFVTKNGYTLVLEKSEIPERNSPASGVGLIKVREGDALTAIAPWAARGKFELVLDDERAREMTGKEFAVGHRGLQGQKVIRKGQVVNCKRLET